MAWWWCDGSSSLILLPCAFTIMSFLVMRFWRYAHVHYAHYNTNFRGRRASSRTLHVPLYIDQYPWMMTCDDFPAGSGVSRSDMSEGILRESLFKRVRPAKGLKRDSKMNNKLKLASQKRSATNEMAAPARKSTRKSTRPASKRLNKGSSE